MLTGDFVVRHRIGALELLDGEPHLYHFGDGRVVLQKDSLPRLQYKLSDHLGTTVILFEDRNGNGVVEEISGQPENSEVLQRQLYYPFGLALRGPMPQQPSPAQDYRYNGKERLPGSELYAYGFRHYDPTVGRFLGVDPISGQMAAWSPYAYTFQNPVRFTDPTGMFPVEGDGDYYDIRGNFIGTDGIDDGKIYVMNSDNLGMCSGMSCLDLKSVSTEVQLSTSENKNATLSNWAGMYQGLSNRYSNDSKGDREFAMSLYTGFINSSDGRQEVFAEGKTINGRKGVNGLSLVDSKSPINGWNATETIHTHRWGNDSGDFSDDPGYIPGDIQTSLKMGHPLYLVVPYSNHIGSFNPNIYNGKIQSGSSHSSAKRSAINANAIKIR